MITHCFFQYVNQKIARRWLVKINRRQYITLQSISTDILSYKSVTLKGHMDTISDWRNLQTKNPVKLLSTKITWQPLEKLHKSLEAGRIHKCTRGMPDSCNILSTIRDKLLPQRDLSIQCFLKDIFLSVSVLPFKLLSQQPESTHYYVVKGLHNNTHHKTTLLLM